MYPPNDGDLTFVLTSGGHNAGALSVNLGIHIVTFDGACALMAPERSGRMNGGTSRRRRHSGGRELADAAHGLAAPPIGATPSLGASPSEGELRRLVGRRDEHSCAASANSPTQSTRIRPAASFCPAIHPARAFGHERAGAYESDDVDAQVH